MKMLDLIEALQNLARSLVYVQYMVAGLSYVLGLLLILIAFFKFKTIAEKTGTVSSHEKMFVPMAYFLGGAALLFLPSALLVLSHTAFGQSPNILAYQPFETHNVLDAVSILVRTAGLIWFARGCVLLAQASEPGVQHGPKGLTFLIAGILAINFEATFEYLSAMIEKIMSYITKVPKV